VQFAWLIVGLQFLRLVLKKAALRVIILFRNIHESFPFFGKLVAGWGNLAKRRVGISKLKRKSRWQKCDASYHRHVAHTRRPAMNEYEIDGSMSDREEDHLIPLQFGGKLISTEHTSSNTKRIDWSEF